MSYGRGPPNTSGMTSLKVDNLTYRTTTDDLKRIFNKYGEIGDVYIPRDRVNRESRGFAFVRYYDRRDADDAMDALDGSMVDGRELRVQLAKYGRPSEPYRGSRGGYGGRRRRSYSRSRSRSRSRDRRRRSRSRSRSQSRSRSRSKGSKDRSPSRSPRRNKSRSNSKSRSRSKSP